MCTHWTCSNLTALVCCQPCWWSSTSDIITSGGEKSMVRWKSTHFVSFKHLSIICYFKDRNFPANTRRLPNVGSTLARRLRRRSNNKPTSGIHLMFDEFAYLGCAVSSCLYSTVELCMQQLFRVWLSQIVLALFDGIWEIDIICMWTNYRQFNWHVYRAFCRFCVHNCFVSKKNWFYTSGRDKIEFVEGQ